MFGFFKREKFLASKHLLVDIHSHLLPNIDDGVRSIEEALEIINKFQELGFKKLIITPHIMADVYPNTKETIKKAYEQLKNALLQEKLTIEIEFGAEHYLDENFFSLLENSEVCLIQNKYLLFETSYVARPIFLEDAIFEIKSKGFVPLLAHPERYRYMKDMKEYERLKELEVAFQINGNSLIGAYGKEAQKKAKLLLEAGFIDFIGSDTHKMAHLDKYEDFLGNKKIFDKLFKRNHIKNATLLKEI